MDCDTSYIGETGSDLQKQIVEHKAAVRRKDDKNGSAVHTNRHNHRVDWVEEKNSRGNPYAETEANKQSGLWTGTKRNSDSLPGVLTQATRT